MQFGSEKHASGTAAATLPAAIPPAPLTWLYLVAGIVGLISVVVPHDPVVDVRGVLVVSALALGTAAALHVVGRQLSPGAVNALLFLGTMLTSAGIHLTGGVPNATSSLYTWIALYAFYALDRRAAVMHLASVGAVYAAVIAVHPPPFPVVAHWTTTMGTLLGAGLLVGVLRERLDKVFVRLAEAARTDPLTELVNRRGLRELLDQEVARAGRTARPFALIVADLDRFKLVNDSLGHTAGDEVLRGFAALLKEVTRSIDGAARIGGEEFALLLPETTREEATAVAERLRADVPRRLLAPGMVLTASFGVAAWPEDGPSPEAIMHRADRALYAAKRTGRNRVVAYGPGATEQLLGEGQRTRRRDRAADALVVLAESLDVRDPSTAAHSATVARYAAAIGDHLGLPPERIERLHLAGLLHDVGKIGMPDALLHKRAPLTSAERVQIERHPELGARLLEGAGLDDVGEWVRSHHERVDGLGYPRGLSGAEIPVEARILAVADAYEAMTADRPYRRALSSRQARAELERHVGTQFDADVVAVFLAAFPLAARAAA